MAANMRPSVAAAWPAVCSRFEGRCWWMYLDTKLLVTTGLGILLETVEEAQTYPWTRVSDGTLAEPAEIEAEYKRVKALTSLARFSGFAYKPSARLRLPEDIIDAALQETTTRFWNAFKRIHPAVDTWPADAQLAAMDLIWQNGAGFTEKRDSDGDIIWANMRQAFLSQNWTLAASAVPGTHTRAHTRRRLFANAAFVAEKGMDRDVLWDTLTPVDPGPVPSPAVRPKPLHGDRDAKVWVDLNGKISTTGVRTSLYKFRVTTRSLNMFLEAVALYHEAGGVTRPQITQGGWNAGAVSASAGTHDEDALDVRTKDMTRTEKRLWEVSSWITGWAGWLRLRIVDLWPEHWHGIPKGGHLSGSKTRRTGAEGQLIQFQQSRSGLASWGMYERIRQMNVQFWTWEDYLASWGVTLSTLQLAFAERRKHEDVKDVQFALSRHLGEDVFADGDPGPKTKAALAKVGPLTRETLIKIGLEVVAEPPPAEPVA